MRDDDELDAEVRRWKTTELLRRLHPLTQKVPKAAGGLGTQSATSSGFIAYALDMQIVQRLVDLVLRACFCPAPHPEYGDDGYRHELRREALEALEWAERWVDWRNRAQWSGARSEWLMTLPAPEPT